jgi:hypothetical protein
VARNIRILIAAAAVAFLGAHIWLFPRSLEDIDTINLALGVEDYDVTQHRPHPPGYPVFIAMAKGSTAVLGGIAPAWDRTERAAIGLAVWGILAGSLAAWVFVRFWTMLAMPSIAAWFAAVLVMVSPLFWFTAARPLTDVAALVAAVAVQCGLLLGWRGLRVEDRPSSAVIAAAAAAAGLLIGLRTQTMWLTGPLLAAVVGQRLFAGEWRHALRLTLASAAGALVWAVPLVWISGGVDRYLDALFFQGADDFRAVSMLATRPELDVLFERLAATFVAPWRVEWLGELITLLAAAGLVVTARANRRAVVVVVVAYVPYLVFHLLFQDVDTVRYALPLLVPVAGLAVRTIWSMRFRFAVAASAMITLVAFAAAVPALLHYHRDVPPTFLAFHDAEAEAASADDDPLVVTHDGMRRVADWFRPEWPSLPAQRPDERVWLRLIEHFRKDAAGRAWLLADRRRMQAVLFDHRDRTVVKEYLRAPAVRRFIGQTRQDEVRWWELHQPGWMLEQGWALSPDLGAIAFADGREPHQVPATGYLRRSPAAHRLMIGGRCLACTDEGVLVVEIEGTTVARRSIVPIEPWFLFWVDVPPGVLEGEGAYAPVSVRVAPVGGGQVPRVELVQFDFASRDELMAGLSEGWYEGEANLETGEIWRWSGERSTLAVYGGTSGARLFLSGESTLRSFDRPSVVTVRANGEVVKRFEARSDFCEVIELPAGLMLQEPSKVTVETDQVFVPAERGQSGDRRRLGLRLWRAEIR